MEISVLATQVKKMERKTIPSSFSYIPLIKVQNGSATTTNVELTP